MVGVSLGEHHWIWGGFQQVLWVVPAAQTGIFPMAEGWSCQGWLVPTALSRNEAWLSSFLPQGHVLLYSGMGI